MIDLNDSHDAIYINDHREDRRQRENHQDLSAVAKFEIFESSSDDELSQGAYESAAASYEKQVERLKRLNGEPLDDDEEKDDDEEEVLQDSQAERERKLKDKQRRMERKRQEKRRKEREQEREQRKLALLKTFKPDLSPYADRLIKDELQEDILNFKDSDRESLISYL